LDCLFIIIWRIFPDGFYLSLGTASVNMTNLRNCRATAIAAATGTWIFCDRNLRFCKESEIKMLSQTDLFIRRLLPHILYTVSHLHNNRLRPRHLS